MATANGSTSTNSSGESNVSFDYTTKGGSDCISDANMAEIVRRIQGFVTSDETGDVVFSVNAPNDTRKLWIEISSTGAIIGTIKRYDTSTGSWVDDHYVPGAAADPLQIDITATTPGAADQVVVYNHNFGTTDYFYTVAYTDDPTASGRWFETASDADNLTLRFLDLSGVSLVVKILEYDNA